MFLHHRAYIHINYVVLQFKTPSAASKVLILRFNISKVMYVKHSMYVLSFDFEWLSQFFGDHYHIISPYNFLYMWFVDHKYMFIVIQERVCSGYIIFFVAWLAQIILKTVDSVEQKWHDMNS